MQAKLKPVKQKVIAILTVLVMLAAALSYLSFPAFAGEAEAATTEPYQKEAVEISNGEFDQTSGSLPFEPSNWTAAELGEQPKGATVSGVVDLTPDEINKEQTLKDLKLDIYDEFKHGGFPQTPFGKSVSENASQLYFPGTNSKALMINSNESQIAYGYKSSSVSLTSNSYYKISAWVKTGEFDNSGASLMVDGLKNPLIFRNIETDPALNNNKDKNYGWVEYNFFIETSSMMDTSVTLSLQLGDAYTYTDSSGKTHSELHTATGYAFFDHITAYKLAPDEFLKNTENINDKTVGFPYPDKEDRTYSLSADGTQMYYSENEAEYLCIENGKIVSSDAAGFAGNEVGSFDNGSKGWSAAEESSGNFQYGIFDSPNEALGIESAAPYSPNGTGDRIALVSTYDRSNNEKYESKNVGIVTDYFTVERFVNYRLSVWVKTENGAVASAAVTGYDYRGGKTDPGVDYGKPQLRKTTELTEGDAENKARNGWKELAFYIKGSSFAAYDVRLELRLGKMAEDGKTEDAAGVAMFDNVRIERITSKEYTDYSGGGTSVTFDPEAASSSITNNEFNNIEAYDEYIQPFKPSGWTLMGAGEDSTTGMSTHKVNEDYKNYVVSGVIASDATSFKYRKPDGTEYIDGNITTHKQTEANGVPSNLLMIKCDEETKLPAEQRKLGGVAVGYRSSSFSISSESVQRVDVTMLADEIEGYGASIVLKNATNVIASVEGIKTTGNRYETYSFYVQTGTSDLSEVYLEVWLGLYDRNNNTDKLAYGTLLVENVSLTNMSAAESSGDDAADDSAKQQALESARSLYAAKANEYHAKRAGAPTNYAVYSSLTEDFAAFDYYQTNDYVRIPYSWTIGSVASNNGNDALRYGIFDASEQAPANYEHNAENRYTMLVQNVTPAATRIKSTINYALASGSYYTIEVVAKVDIPTAQKAERPNYKGAYIGITDTDHKISDIKSTATVTDIFNPDSDVEGEYKTFTFYIKTAGELATDDDTDSSNTSDTIVTMEMGIGGTGSNEEWAVGTMYVNSITVTQSSNVDFEEAQAALEKGGALQGKYSVIADYSDKKDDPDKDDDKDDNNNITGDNWYVYTTVLLAVVLIVVLIAVAVRYYGIKRKRDAAGSAGAPSYDREKTLVRQHNKRAEEAGAIRDKQLDAYEAFDEIEEDLIEEEQLRKLQAEELAILDAAEAAESEATAPEAETDNADESPAEAESEEVTISEEQATEPTAEATETTENGAPTEEEADENIYDQIVDFTPSEEKKKELEAKKAAEERAKAEKEAAEKKAAEERAKAEAEKKAANRRYNNWDSFDD